VREEEWDRMDEQEFARFSMEWLALARKAADELISFCSCYGPFRPLVEMLYPRVRVMVWNKPPGSQYGGSSERGLWFAHETVLHGYRPVERQYVSPKGLGLARQIRAAREKAGLSRGAVDTALRGKKTGLCYRWEEGACLPSPEQARKLTDLFRLDGEFSTALEAAYADRDATLERVRAGASENAAEGMDVFTYRTETGGLHPCRKPLGLMCELIERLAPEGLIIDPFAGSGTTLRAAKDCGRPAAGIEAEERYCELAARLLEQGVLAFSP
jgi:hypothetical protein